MQDNTIREIPLTQGKVAIVDAVDFDRVNAFKWFAHSSHRVFYAHTNITKNGKRTTLMMHQFVSGLPYVDHKDGNGLNNTRLNLRACTSQQNQMNRGPQRNNDLGLKGVCVAGER